MVPGTGNNFLIIICDIIEYLVIRKCIATIIKSYNTSVHFLLVHLMSDTII